MSDRFEEADWERLLDRIEHRHVLPVLGPALVTLDAGGRAVPLLQYLAEPLAQRLDLPAGNARNVMDVARLYISSGRHRSALDDALRSLLRQQTTPSPGLLALAGIEGFDLFVSSTPDGLMAQALLQARAGFDAQRHVFFFHPNGRSAPHPHPHSDASRPNCDLPAKAGETWLYQIMGSLQSRDFAVWEEDYMEFICGLIEQRGTLEQLFQRLKGSDLLLIGAPSEDWIVRFFLRAARGKRLSDDGQHARHYLADRRGDLTEPMMFFFEKATRLTRVIDGDPTRFALELARRWGERGRPPPDTDLFARLPESCPRDAVFLSYAREDAQAVEQLALALHRQGVPFWLDRRELQFGENFDRAMEAQIKLNCSFFVALVSLATEDERNAARYFHRERAWAAGRQSESYVFYLQVFVDLPLGHTCRHEPPQVRGLQAARLEDADAFAKRLRRYVDENRSRGRPRG